MNRRTLNAHARRLGARPDLVAEGPNGALYVLDDRSNPYRRADLQALARTRIALPRHTLTGGGRRPAQQQGGGAS